jgi:hypothetical protein
VAEEVKAAQHGHVRDATKCTKAAFVTGTVDGHNMPITAKKT